MPLPHTTRGWFTLAEQGVLRMIMMMLGILLMIVGLALGVSMVMLPVGIVVGLIGAGLLVWGALGDLPINKRR